MILWVVKHSGYVYADTGHTDSFSGFARDTTWKELRKKITA